MNETMSPMETHLSDADLVRRLDGELSAWEASEVAAHLGDCAACASRYEAMARRSDQVSEALLSVDSPMSTVTELPTRLREETTVRRRVARTPTWLRMAASVLLLTGVTMTVSPLRAWVADQWAGLVAGVGAEDPVPVEVSPGVAGDGAVVSFPITDTESFLLDVRNVLGSGEMQLQVHRDTQATAEVLGGTGDEELTVLPGALRIDHAASSATYRITLPTDLANVTVRIEGRGDQHVSVEEVERSGESVLIPILPQP